MNQFNIISGFNTTVFSILVIVITEFVIQKFIISLIKEILKDYSKK